MYRRNTSLTLEQRLQEPRQFMQIVVGPRQTGKTTAIKQAVKALGLPARVASADSTQELGEAWLEAQWLQARTLASTNPSGALLVIDEVQKIKRWSEAVKRLWDEDSWQDVNLKVVLSGSSSLMLAKGLSESLAGRFELLRSTHWSLGEMRAAFDYTLEDYLRYGGYPGAAALKANPQRWQRYLHDSIIEATISRDILQLEDVRKPALMRALFELGAQYSAQELSYRKILGQLDDKGNTDTIKSYLTLLDGAGMMSGLQKFDAKQLKTYASSPRLMVHDPALMTASWRGTGNLMEDPALRGHLVETAVGAHLIAQSHKEDFSLYWWRDGDQEVDFVVARGDAVTAIEVKSGTVKRSGILAFCKKFPGAQPLVVGDRNTSLEDFLLGNVAF
jgi:hypothetical protein